MGRPEPQRRHRPRAGHDAVEAEPIKLSVSLLEPAEAWISIRARGQGSQALSDELQPFASELVSSLQFYQGQPGSLGIAEVVLSGGTAQLPGSTSSSGACSA